MRQKQASLPFILITIFLDVLGIGLMIPVLPSVVGSMTSSPDMQSWWYGALMVTYGLVQFFSVPLLGALSDRYGRRPVLLLSTFGLGFSYIVTATTHSLIILLLSRIVSGATGASFTVASAYIADITKPEERAKGFGIMGAAFGVGFIFGPAIGGLLGAVDLRLPFKVAAGLALLNWLYGFFVLPESLPADRRSPVSLARANPLGALLHLSQLKGVGGLITVFALSILAQWVLQTTWVLYTTFRFHWDTRDNGMALFVVGVTSAIVQGVLLGRLLKRFGEARLALLGMASATFIYVCYGLVTQGWMLYCLIFANFLSFAATPALQAIISKASDPRQQGLTQGSLNSIQSVTTVVAPLIGTPLLAMVARLPAHDWRIGITFFVSAALELLALVLAIVHFRKLDRVPVAAPASAD
jgi:DHA1 family tetracycline resistance protein-like MFS transporter